MEVKRSRVVQYGIAIIVSLCSLASGAWLAWPSPTIKKLMDGEACCTMDQSQIGTMVAMMDLGNMVSPVPASYVCDSYGRKPVILSTALMFIAAGACVMVANSVWYLYAARFVLGLAKGIAFAVVPLFIAEIAEVKIRGALCTIFGIFISAGLTYDYVFGAILSYQQLNLVNLLIPIIMVIGFFLVPETPYFLVMRNRFDDAKKNLGFFRQLHEDDETLNTEMELIKTTVKSDMENKGRFIDIVTTKSRRRALLIVTVASTAQRLSGISPLLAFSNETLPKNGAGASREVYIILFSIVMIVTNYIGLLIVDKLGRKKLLIFSSLSCGIIDAILGIFFTVKCTYSWIPYACLLLFGFCWSLGLCIVPSILVGELFPTNVKTHASSTTSIILAVNSFLINEMFVEVTKVYGVDVMFYFFSATSVLCAVFFMFLQFETKGKTFQEIQTRLRQEAGENVQRIDKPKC